MMYIRPFALAWLTWLALVAFGCGEATTAGESCTDGIFNQDETDVDCGGSCSACLNGKHCKYPEDCYSGNCEAGVCQPSETCQIGETRCNSADNLETCAYPGHRWEETVCPHGCATSGGQSHCVGAAGGLPTHSKFTAGSGQAKSAAFFARVRIGAPLIVGTSYGSGKSLHGGPPASP